MYTSIYTDTSRSELVFHFKRTPIASEMASQCQGNKTNIAGDSTPPLWIEVNPAVLSPGCSESSASTDN